MILADNEEHLLGWAIVSFYVVFLFFLPSVRRIKSMNLVGREKHEPIKTSDSLRSLSLSLSLCPKRTVIGRTKAYRVIVGELQ